MEAIAALSHRGLRFALAVHALAAVMVAALMSGLGGTIPLAGGDLVLGALCAVFIVAASAYAIAWMLNGSFVWERRLERMNVDDSTAFQIPAATGSSLADFGWNRLVEQGRRWETLHELEASVASRLSRQNSSDDASILNGLTDGLAAVDLDGRIAVVNAALSAMSGVDDSDDLIGRPLDELFGDPEEWRQHTADKSPHMHLSFDLAPTARHEDRRFRVFRRPRHNVGGDPVGFVWTVRDVTQQRLAEAMRDQFLSAATHELRTPLSNIRAYAESLEMSPDIDVEARKRFYNIIQTESVRLAQLVDDLLDISRIQAGAMAIERTETDLGRLVEEASAKVAAQMKSKNLQYRCEFPPKFPKATVDKAKLVAALVNLLGNAAKYTPAGGRVTFRVDATPQRIQFSISDTGIGISEEELPKVFDRFFRSGDDRVRDVTGSGLGLALVAEVARLHGGEVTVESVLNQGSTFRLTIPLDGPK